MLNQLNRRREPRTKVSLEGTISTRRAIYPCRLADLSKSGARLVFEHPVFLRGDFELNVDELLHERCVEIWRSDVQVGVAFRRGRADAAMDQNLTS